jgi:hypothetical protein
MKSFDAKSRLQFFAKFFFWTADAKKPQSGKRSGARVEVKSPRFLLKKGSEGREPGGGASKRF